VAITVMNSTLACTWQVGHVQHRSGHMVHIHARFGRTLPSACGCRRPCLRHVGGGVADVDLAHRNVEGPAVQRAAAGQAGDRVFGGGVGHRMRDGCVGRDRAVVDDAATHAAAAAFIMRKACWVQRKAPVRLMSTRLLPVPMASSSMGTPGNEDAGVVEQQVQPAEAGAHEVEHGGHGVGPGHIGGHGVSAFADVAKGVADLGDRCAQRFQAPAAEHHAPAVMGQSQRRGAANATAAASDQGDAVVRGVHADPRGQKTTARSLCACRADARAWAPALVATGNAAVGTECQSQWVDPSPGPRSQRRAA
jgi:hypothetical protein